MVIQSQCICVCACVARHDKSIAQEDYLWDGLNKTNAIISSLNLNQAGAEVIPVVFPLAKKRCLLLLVKLRDTHHLITSQITWTVQQGFLTLLVLRKTNIYIQWVTGLHVLYKPKRMVTVVLYHWILNFRFRI